MSAEVIPMTTPRRATAVPAGRTPFMVSVRHGDDGWWTICRNHSWLYPSRSEALKDASEIAAGFGVGLVIDIAGRA